MNRASLTELDALIAVARTGTFQAAAKELGLSTSALSAAIARLEARLETRLFHRTTRSVSLTEAGQRYIERIGPALAEIHRASDEIGSQPEAPSGTLRINASAEAIRMIFDPLLVDYLRRFPAMRLDIVSESRMIDIVEEGFDAGIRLAESVPQDMIAVPLSDDLRMRVVGAPEYLAQHGHPQSPEALQDHVTLAMRMSHGGIYRWELEKDGQQFEVELAPRLVFTDSRTIHDAACAGFGLAFLSEWHIGDDLATGRLVSLLDDWCPPFPGLRLYYPGRRYLPPGLRALVDMIRARHG